MRFNDIPPLVAAHSRRFVLNDLNNKTPVSFFLSFHARAGDQLKLVKTTGCRKPGENLELNV
jgi:hypothetical protein